jgi:streptomycin 6-kinase
VTTPLFSLPVEIAELSKAHGFVPTEELPGGHCSRILADATRVLKLPFQGEELTWGLLAARKLEAIGGPKIFAVSEDPAAVLMERIWPGTPLSESDLSDAERLETYLEIRNRMPSVDPTAGMPLEDYLESPEQRATQPEWRRTLTRTLLATTEREEFLHGDLHHANILFDGKEWRPLDPKGLIGDPHYEPIAFLRNPCDQLAKIADLVGFTRDRIKAICDATGFSPWRLAAWGRLDQADEGDYDSDDPWSRLPHVFATLEEELRPEGLKDRSST